MTDGAEIIFEELYAPFAGGILYAAVGLKPVMYASVLCFFITALLECFIKLPYQAGNFRYYGMCDWTACPQSKGNVGWFRKCVVWEKRRRRYV